MNNKKTLLLALGAFGANQLHDAHLLLVDVEKRPATQLAAEAPLYCCLSHNTEPERPGGLLRMPWTVAVSTATATVSSAAIIGPWLGG